MTQEAFIKELKERRISYEVQGEKIIVTHRGDVWLPFLKTIPSGVEFGNARDVHLNSLEAIPPGVVFRNTGYVGLPSLETISPGVEFRNTGHVYLGPLLGGWVDGWRGNIEGVDSQRLLNHLIKKGAFV